MSQRQPTKNPTPDSSTGGRRFGNLAYRVPFVSPTLRAFWLQPCMACDVVWSQPVNDDGTIGDMAPYYRLTSAVYAWMRQRIRAVEDRVAAGERELAGPLLEAAERWRPLAEWAERVYTQEELTAAVPKLPQPEVKAETVKEWKRIEG